MCLPGSLRMFFVALNCVKTLMACYFIIAGAIVASDVSLRQGFGGHVEGIGGGIIALGFLIPFNSVISHFGSQYHNKFLLLVHAVFDMGILATQFGLGGSLLAETHDAFPMGMRQECQRNFPNPALYAPEECAEYWDHDRTAGVRLVWLDWVSRGSVDPNYLQTVLQLQDAYECCGFGPPLRCVTNTNPFPESFDMSEIDSPWLEIRQECRRREWYPETWDCQHIVDPNAVVLEVGGCHYDNPIGECRDLPVMSETSGCADAMEQILVGKISTLAYALVFMTSLQAVSISIACCYCWKRRATDVLPDFLHNVPWDPYAVDQKRPVEEADEDAAGGAKAAVKSPTKKAPPKQ